MASSLSSWADDFVFEITAGSGHIPNMKLLPAFLLLTAMAGAFAQNTPALPPLPPDGFVTLQQIVGDFTAQPQAALQKYQGQRVLVYGRVGQVAQANDSEGNPLNVFLQLPNNPTPDVKCVFTLADIPGWAQDAEVQIPDDGSQAVIARRNQEGNVTREKPFVVVGQNVGIHGTFDRFEAGDVVLKDAKKAGPEKLAEILNQHGISTE